VFVGKSSAWSTGAVPQSEQMFRQRRNELFRAELTKRETVLAHEVQMRMVSASDSAVKDFVRVGEARALCGNLCVQQRPRVLLSERKSYSTRTR